MALNFLQRFQSRVAVLEKNFVKARTFQPNASCQITHAAAAFSKL